MPRLKIYDETAGTWGYVGVGDPGPAGPPPTVYFQPEPPTDTTGLWIDSDALGYGDQAKVGGTQPIATTPWVWFDLTDGDLQLWYEDGL